MKILLHNTLHETAFRAVWKCYRISILLCQIKMMQSYCSGGQEEKERRKIESLKTILGSLAFTTAFIICPCGAELIMTRDSLTVTRVSSNQEAFPTHVLPYM